MRWTRVVTTRLRRSTSSGIQQKLAGRWNSKLLVWECSAWRTMVKRTFPIAVWRVSGQPHSPENCTCHGPADRLRKQVPVMHPAGSDAPLLPKLLWREEWKQTALGPETGAPSSRNASKRTLREHHRWQIQPAFRETLAAGPHRRFRHPDAPQLPGLLRTTIHPKRLPQQPTLEK